MAISFASDRWKQVSTNYRRWWQGELERPLIPIVLSNRDPGRPEPATPLLTQATCHDLSIPADKLIDRIDYELSTCSYLGDAFPFFNMDCFGPGVLSAILGATLDNSAGSVWFHPSRRLPIQDLHVHFDPDNVWFRRIAAIYEAALRRWQGQVLMGMPDLGGTLDILSVFRPGEELLLDLCESPEDVKRLTWEIHEAWHACYNAFNGILQPVNPGYSDWGMIYSDEPCYVLQSDFSYMIGPDMFDEFVKPELAASVRRLGNTMYHLDGKGQLPHLDLLLSIQELKAVQWVPGAGSPDCSHWPEVYRKIHAAGKRIQLLGNFMPDGFDILDAVGRQLGSTRGIHFRFAAGPDKAWLQNKLEQYGIMNCE